MIKPLHDNVVLKKEKVENKTSSGIILTTESKSMPSVATVVAIGKDCKAEIKENDQVVYKEYSGTNIKIDEVEYIIISEKDILGYMMEEWETTKELLSYFDVMVDGEFQIEHKDLGLAFKGSSNQRTIMVQESLQKGRLCIWQPQ